MNLFLYFLTAVLYIFSFPNFVLSQCTLPECALVAWICLVPFIIAVDREKDIFSVIKGSFLCGWIIFLGGMSWLTEVTWLGYIILTLYMALYIVIFGMICFYNKNYFIVPLAWTALEFIRGNLGGGIPWLLLGSSQYQSISLIQIANITGVYGISFLVAMVSAKIARQASGFSPSFRIRSPKFYLGQAFRSPKFYLGRPLAYRGWIFVLCILGAVILYGKYEIKKSVTGTKVRIGLVQPNVPLEIKWDPQYTNWMVDKMVAISEDAVPCDILIWPETAVPTLPESMNIQKQLSLMTGELGCALIVGSQGVSGEKSYYNSAFLISKEGRLSGEYRKIHLVPFGEYVPFEEELPFLRNLTPIQGEFRAGTEYTIFNLNGLNSAVLICFEDIFPDLARRFVSKGANILINITNDAWFGESAGPYQHAALSVFRAVENKVPLVRATNTGLSCFINQNGEIIKTINDLSGKELLVEGYAVKEIVAGNDNTFYTRYGDIFSLGCIIILISLFCVRIIRRRLQC